MSYYNAIVTLLLQRQIHDVIIRIDQEGCDQGS